MTEKNKNKYRNKTFNLVLYPEDSTHEKALEVLRSKYDHAYILHDRDCDENGEIKKAHYHVVIKVKNAIWNTSLANELGITANYIERCRDLKNSLLYLIHFNDGDKMQYDFEEVKGNLTSYLKKYMNTDNKEEDLMMLELIQYIDNSLFLNYTNLVKWACENGFYSTLRRGGYLVSQLIEEHNGKFSKEIKGNINDSVAQFNWEQKAKGGF